MLELMSFPLKEIAGALARRVGTMFSAFLIANDVPAELVGQFLVACGVLLGLGFDVLLALFYRRKLRDATRALVERELPNPPSDPALVAGRVRPL